MAKIGDRVNCMSGLILDSIFCLASFGDFLVHCYRDFDDLGRKNSRFMGAFCEQSQLSVFFEKAPSYDQVTIARTQ